MEILTHSLVGLFGIVLGVGLTIRFFRKEIEVGSVTIAINNALIKSFMEEAEKKPSLEVYKGGKDE